MYIVFTGDAYYPSGGALDFYSLHETLEDAKFFTPNYDWAHIVRIAEGEFKIIAEVVYDRHVHMTRVILSNPHWEDIEEV